MTEKNTSPRARKTYDKKEYQNVDPIIWEDIGELKQEVIKLLQADLPSDYNCSRDDLASEVDFTLIYLIKRFETGKISLYSYCQKYANIITYHRLMTEYHRVRSQIPIDFIADYEFEDNFEEPHEHGEYEIQDTQDIGNKLENNDQIEQAYENATQLDTEIMNMIYCGHDYEYIAKKLGISKGTITNRMKILGKQMKS